jgi:hypothetical protein
VIYSGFYANGNALIYLDEKRFSPSDIIFTASRAIHSSWTGSERVHGKHQIPFRAEFSAAFWTPMGIEERVFSGISSAQSCCLRKNILVETTAVYLGALWDCYSDYSWKPMLAVGPCCGPRARNSAKSARL